MNVAGVLLVVLEAVMNTTGFKENRLRVRAIVINMVDVHLNEVNNTVLLDEGCGPARQSQMKTVMNFICIAK